MIGEFSTEVLRSHPETGAYIAFTGQVPVTQYFEILRRADCDDRIYIQFINPEMIRANPGYYLSGRYPGDKPALKCAGEFHKKYRDKSDERLSGADGVIFDIDSFSYTDIDGGANGHAKVRMDGWAIKFVEPSDFAIRARLAKKPLTAIEDLQMKTVAYWIKTNRAGQYANELKALLPIADKSTALNGWKGSYRDVLHALAEVEEVTASDDVYLKIMQAGIAEMLVPGSLTTIGNSNASDVPYVAANVLACRNNPGTVEALRNILLKATITQHKLAAARALILMGDKTYIKQQLELGRLGDVSRNVTVMLSGRDAEKFYCPYGSKPNA